MIRSETVVAESDPYLVILGIAQDGCYPHAGCHKTCCAGVWQGATEKHLVSCLAVVDPQSQQRFLFDCTPDFISQLHLLDSLAPAPVLLDGIFLTHAHIGHYTGLMHLGREVLGTQKVPVYAMPRFREYLQNNGPWSQLVSLGNISIKALQEDSTVQVSTRIAVTPFRVPHRDEYSETVGFRLTTKNRSVIFIPDIDKWEKWNRDLLQLVRENDLLFLDGTFYRDGEISGRSMKDIPHPFIEETMQKLSGLTDAEKSKVYFIHLNHTNPALPLESEARKLVEQQGFGVAAELQRFPL